MSDGTRQDRRFHAAIDMTVRVAAGELGVRIAPSPAGDELDALLNGLNMLTEELEAEHARRLRAEGLLDDEVDAYENAPAFFCSVAGDTLVIEKCNQTLATALGRTKEELIGRSVLDLFADDDRTHVERELRRIADGVTASGGELRLQREGAGHLLVDTSASRVMLGGHERLRIIWRDVSAVRRLEAQLLQAQKLEALGRLSGGVAHDFNNILAVIMSSSALLRDVLRQEGIESEDLALIEQAAARGAALTNDLLAFSRRRVVAPRPTDVRVSLLEAERMIRRLVGDGIRVSTRVADQPLVAVVDPSQLWQVLVNLSVNARDAMPEGGHLTLEAVRVDLDPEQAGGKLDLAAGPHALIAVSDSGAGMPPEILAQVFEPFFTTKPIGQGSGLGLSMCYGIIRQAGGAISIYSEVGRGTTVKVYLPLAASDAASERVREVSVTRGGAETILIVDDNEIVRKIVLRILRGRGYAVLEAADGASAVAVAAAHRGTIHLVITDVMMPNMGGSELAAELQATRPETRILYVSGYTANAIVEQGVLKPNTDFLAKPFTPKALLASVRTILDRD
ncbi:MAG: response regulator [Myxococcales bacterium]|nr:response regulator [Myxococcales bacterium]